MFYHYQQGFSGFEPPHRSWVLEMTSVFMSWLAVAWRFVRFSKLTMANKDERCGNAALLLTILEAFFVSSKSLILNSDDSVLFTHVTMFKQSDSLRL